MYDGTLILKWLDYSLHWFHCKHKKLSTMCIDFCVIVIQPINIGEQERQGIMFTTTTRAKYLNVLWFMISIIFFI